MLALVFVTANPCRAATLHFGHDRRYHQPSDAAAVAHDGDTVLIDSGTYRDCAVWQANRLTIVGAGRKETVIGGRSCEDKGVFVVYGDDILIRGMTLRGAHVPDQNGAGVRAEGTNLTLQRVGLIDDQDGMLADPVAASVIIVTDSLIKNDGLCAAYCAHGIYVGAIAKLVVSHSTVRDIHVGNGIKSRAAVTEITDDTIEDSVRGTSSYLIDVPNGGQITIAGNALEKGPLSSNPYIAIDIGEEGVTWSNNSIAVQDNDFTNNGVIAATFVNNTTSTPAQLGGNTMAGLIGAVLAGPGTVLP
jgi:hypothetical protein